MLRPGYCILLLVSIIFTPQFVLSPIPGIVYSFFTERYSQANIDLFLTRGVRKNNKILDTASYFVESGVTELDKNQLFPYLFNSSNNAKGTGTTMAGDDTAGFDPGDLLKTYGCSFCVQCFPYTLVHIGGVNEVQMVLLQIMLGSKLFQQQRSHLAELTPILFSSDQSAVDDLNARMQLQQVAHQSRSVAAAAAGPEVVQIIGDEAHFGLLADLHGSGCGLIQGGIGVLCKPLPDCNDHSALTHGYMPGVHDPDVPGVGLLLNGQLAAVVGAGGYSGIGQMQDLQVGILCKQPIVKRSNS